MFSLRDSGVKKVQEEGGEGGVSVVRVRSYDGTPSVVDKVELRETAMGSWTARGNSSCQVESGHLFVFQQAPKYVIVEQPAAVGHIAAVGGPNLRRRSMRHSKMLALPNR